MTMGLDWSYHAHQFIFSFHSHFNFLFILCGRLRWLPVSFFFSGRQLLNCKALRLPIGPNALPLINQLVIEIS